ncbi:MAG: hypothetical protein WB587_05960 [Nitrososphaeraceae archaeon]
MDRRYFFPVFKIFYDDDFHPQLFTIKRITIEGMTPQVKPKGSNPNPRRDSEDYSRTEG